MTQNSNKTKSAKQISVVIPTYNGERWLFETIEKISEAIEQAKVDKYEILIVNDGSTDGTVKTVKDIIEQTNIPIRLVSQENGGRFIARRTGTDNAKFPYLLFVDTRVFIGKNSLKYVLTQLSKDVSRNVWCSHVRVDKEGNIYARFWEAIAYVAWRKYFSNPRDISYGIKEFDDYPKGTTCFFIKKDVLKEANDWFVKNTKDLKTSNDDTLLIRHIAEKHSINVSPGFWCLYHARGSLSQYTKHVYHRGRVFVDGFLRNDGNRFFIPLIMFLFISVLLPILLIIKPILIVPIMLLGFTAWLLELVIILVLRVPIKDGLSLFVLTPIFSIFYGAGIWRAFISIYLLRSIRPQNGSE